MFWSNKYENPSLNTENSLFKTLILGIKKCILLHFLNYDTFNCNYLRNLFFYINNNISTPLSFNIPISTRSNNTLSILLHSLHLLIYIAINVLHYYYNTNPNCMWSQISFSLLNYYVPIQRINHIFQPKHQQIIT